MLECDQCTEKTCYARWINIYRLHNLLDRLNLEGRLEGLSFAEVGALIDQNFQFRCPKKDKTYILPPGLGPVCRCPDCLTFVEEVDEKWAKLSKKKNFQPKYCSHVLEWTKFPDPVCDICGTRCESQDDYCRHTYKQHPDFCMIVLYLEKENLDCRISLEAAICERERVITDA